MRYLLRFYYDVTEQKDGNKVTKEMYDNYLKEIISYIKSLGYQGFTIIPECKGYFVDNGYMVECKSEILEIVTTPENYDSVEEIISEIDSENISDKISQLLNQNEVLGIILEIK